jgi:hypothetical protein
MTGRIESGQRCTQIPLDPEMFEVRDNALCKVAGNEHLHVVNVRSLQHR